MVQRDPRAFAFGFSIGAFSAPQRAGRSTSSPFRAGSTASARYRHRRAGGQPQHVRARDRATGAAWRLLGALGAEIPPGFESNMPLRVGPAPLQRVRRRIRQVPHHAPPGTPRRCRWNGAPGGGNGAFGQGAGPRTPCGTRRRERRRAAGASTRGAAPGVTDVPRGGGCAIGRIIARRFRRPTAPPSPLSAIRPPSRLCRIADKGQRADPERSSWRATEVDSPSGPTSPAARFR